MLHELCHIEHGPHNADFYNLLDEIRKVMNLTYHILKILCAIFVIAYLCFGDNFFFIILFIDRFSSSGPLYYPLDYYCLINEYGYSEYHSLHWFIQRSGMESFLPLFNKAVTF